MNRIAKLAAILLLAYLTANELRRAARLLWAAFAFSARQIWKVKT